MNLYVRLFAFIVGGASLVSSCRKKDDPVVVPTSSTGSVKMNFTNVVGGKAMNLGASWYTNAAGDSFQITTYNYYISNISLTTVDGKTYSEPESYHLIQQSDPNTWHFTIKDVPAGDYTTMRFMIGVDSLHNVSGAQTGDLDPARGMIWDWNTGYIMAKMEGRSPQSPNSNNNFYYHIAGFKSSESVLQWVSLSFPETATVSTATSAPGVHVFSDAAQWFISPSQISIATYNDIVVTGKAAKLIASNYADMFTVDHIDH